MMICPFPFPKIIAGMCTGVCVLLPVPTDLVSDFLSMKPKLWEIMHSRHFVNVYESSITRLIFFLLLCAEI